MDLKHYAQLVAEMRQYQVILEAAKRKGNKQEIAMATGKLINLEKEVDQLTKEILF